MLRLMSSNCDWKVENVAGGCGVVEDANRCMRRASVMTGKLAVTSGTW